MSWFIHRIRLVPIVLFAAAGLFTLKLTGILIDGGYTLGAGMEVGLTPNWSAKIEYLWLDYADRYYSVTGRENGLETSLLRMGVNYRF